jgi:hypothetical protein
VQGGAIKLYKELACPLDGFQLVLFSLGGADGKTYPLCPFCYNHPPFENAPKVGSTFGGLWSCSPGGLGCCVGRETELYFPNRMRGYISNQYFTANAAP